MREPENKPGLSLSVWLIIVIVVAYVFQEHFANVPSPRSDSSWIDYYLALSPTGLQHGYVWQLLTFQFLHGSLLHLFLNGFAIWVFGRIVEQQLGRANFLKVYFASGVVGGLLQVGLGFLFQNRFGGAVVGASAGICGLIAAFAMIAPDAKLLLWLVLPIRAKYFLIGLIVITLFFIIVPSDPGIAHAGHLGGLLSGVAFMRWQLYAPRRNGWRPFQNRQRKRELVKAASVKNIYGYVSKPEPEELPPEEFISREVDPILDKISAHGIQSLTERERKILEAARKKIGKR